MQINKSLDSVSDLSQGEQKPDFDFEKIQKEIRAKYQVKNENDKKKESPALIDMDKLAPFLSQLTQVANHNLAVATTYQIKLQEAQQMVIQERVNSYNAQRQKEFMDRKYDQDTGELKERVSKQESEILVLEELVNKLQNEAHFFGEKIKVKREEIGDLNVELDKKREELRLQLLENQSLRQQLNLKEEKIRQVQDENLQLRLQDGQVELLQKSLDEKVQYYQGQINDLNKRLQEESTAKIVEIKKYAEIYNKQQPLREELEETKQKNIQMVKDMEQQKNEIKRLNDELENFQIKFDVKLQEGLDQFQQKNIDRIVQLEIQHEDMQKKIYSLQGENNNLGIENAKMKGEIDYYLREYKEMDEIMTRNKEEKQQYLEEFNKLKKSYEQCIDKLQKEVFQNQKSIMKLNDELADKKMHLNRTVAKLEDMVEMQTYLTISDQYTQNQIKKEVVDLHVKKKAAEMYERKTLVIKNDIDQFFEKDLEQKQEQIDLQEDNLEDEWNKLFRNINSVQTQLEK